MIRIEINLAEKIERAEAIKQVLKKEWNIKLSKNAPIFPAKIIIDAPGEKAGIKLCLDAKSLAIGQMLKDFIVE